MSKTKRPRSLTLRLDPQLYCDAKNLASLKLVSLNTLIQESIQATLLRAEEQRRFDEYSILGEDLQASNLDYAEAAQAEVMLSDE